MKYIEFRVHASRQGIEHLTMMYMNFGINELHITDPADIQDILESKNEYDWDYIDDSLKTDTDREPYASIYFEDTPENRENYVKIKSNIEIIKIDWVF